MPVTVTLPQLVPSVLAWLMIVGLLLLKPNRTGRAWWILAPLAVALALQTFISAAGWLPMGAGELFEEMGGGLAFGVGALWLLAPVLARRHRFLTLLCMIAALGVASALAMVLRQLGPGGEALQTFFLLVPLAFAVVALGLSLFLTGWFCRHRHGGFRVTGWFVLLLAGVWTVILFPFFAGALLMSGGGPDWLDFFGILLALVGFSAVTALPFLVLAFSNAVYRERLHRLLHLDAPASPPVLAVEGGDPNPLT